MHRRRAPGLPPGRPREPKRYEATTPEGGGLVGRAIDEAGDVCPGRGEGPVRHRHDVATGVEG